MPISIGLHTFEVTPDDQNPYRCNVYEEFVNQEAFDYHQARVKASKWGEVTKNVERFYEVSGG